ncbi:hypothetical protein Poli38472_006257 [Pythium oligandrum]|uniref:Adenosine deaminase domain-containing protein n=1 Tax=Pythium oligandrum TaxID=41045 RepID=A0A8K1FPW8_PYTOL|nr:hypothetical protein Poli38472_006257 [Pythium oligandrum]|eukprot:TMW68789.1 hypothetical protein Poli38472_006257 [Pythium oligandrum]
MVWDAALETWSRSVPKIELHAHIHGSIRPSTLEELLREEAARTQTEPRALPRHRSLDECFEMFHLIHQVVVSRQALHRIVVETIEDFAKENVKYLELRSTPRELERDGASREDYVKEVVAAVEECHARTDLDIQVRLLLSINRNQPLSVAEDTVNMAIEWKKRSPLIVGIDLSGHSERPDSEFHRFEAVLERARQHDLKLAIHFAEHYDDAEADIIMKFRPDRVGHACCLSDDHYKQLMKLRIPIEVCLTSNVHTLARYRKKDCKCDAKDANGLCLCGYRAHPHREVVTLGTSYPLCLCTDDTGVLDTTISREYARAAQAFNLTRARLVEIARGAIFIIFDPSCKASLESALEQFQL